MARPKPGRRAPDDPPEIPLAIPLPKKGLGSLDYWLEEIEASRERMKAELPEWRGNLARYLNAKPELRGIPMAERININVAFQTVENKRPMLFFTTPYLQVSPGDGAAPEVWQGLQDRAPVVQAILNRQLGPDQIDGLSLVGEALDDCMIVSGFGATKIGYDHVTIDVTLPTNRMVPMLDPVTGLPVPDPTTGNPQQTLAVDPKTGQPETRVEKRRVWHRFYWQRIAPDKARIPAGFIGTRYEQAPWLGFEFDASSEQLGRDHDVDPTSFEEGSDTTDDSLISQKDLKYRRPSSKGVEIWYQAALFDPEILNPEQYRRLVIITSRRKRKPVVLVHENSPWQQFEQHEFVRGMRGNPIHLFTLRNSPQSAYPKSDVAMVAELHDEKSRSRSQMLQQRNRSLPLRAFNSLNVRKQVIDQIEGGTWQGLVDFKGPINPSDFQELATAKFPSENFSFDRAIQEDINRTAGIGSNQQGVQNETTDTATEATLMQRAMESRTSKERSRIVWTYVAGVQKLHGLMELFAFEGSTVPMPVADSKTGAMQPQAWDRQTLTGPWAFSTNPDSAMRINAEERRNQFLRYYNVARQDPFANGQALMAKLTEVFAEDPRKMTVEDAPEGKPDLRATLSLKGEDLANPVVHQMLEQAGFEIVIPSGVDNPLAMITAGATNGRGRMPHGGPAPEAARISKHEHDLSGQRSGPPAPAPQV